MKIIKTKTNGESANACHDFLLENNIKPIYFVSDEKSDLFGSVTKTSAEFEIVINDEDFTKTKELLEDFLSHNEGETYE